MFCIVIRIKSPIGCTSFHCISSEFKLIELSCRCVVFYIVKFAWISAFDATIKRNQKLCCRSEFNDCQSMFVFRVHQSYTKRMFIDRTNGKRKHITIYQMHFRFVCVFFCLLYLFVDFNIILFILFLVVIIISYPFISLRYSTSIYKGFFFCLKGFFHIFFLFLSIFLFIRGEWFVIARYNYQMISFFCCCYCCCIQWQTFDELLQVAWKWSLSIMSLFIAHRRFELRKICLFLIYLETRATLFGFS